MALPVVADLEAAFAFGGRHLRDFDYGMAPADGLFSPTTAADASSASVSRRPSGLVMGRVSFLGDDAEFTAAAALPSGHDLRMSGVHGPEGPALFSGRDRPQGPLPGRMPFLAPIGAIGKRTPPPLLVQAPSNGPWHPRRHAWSPPATG